VSESDDGNSTYMNEVPVQSCVNKADDDFRDAIPVFVNVDIGLTWRLSHMSRDPLLHC
jgi:hypothetical protein